MTGRGNTTSSGITGRAVSGMFYRVRAPDGVTVARFSCDFVGHRERT